MVLCPENLWHFEKRNQIKLKYVISQSITLFLMTIQLLYVIYSYDKMESYKNQLELLDATIEELILQMHYLYILDVIFFECYIPIYAYFFFSLFCCQLCQIDKKISKVRSNFIINSFKCRLLARIICQFLLSALLIMIIVQTIIINRQISQYNQDSMDNLENEFDKQIFYPNATNVILFLGTVIIDNMYYFIFACLSKNVYWGSYHEVMVCTERSIETTTFSFGIGNENSTNQNNSINSKQTANFEAFID